MATQRRFDIVLLYYFWQKKNICDYNTFQFKKNICVQCLLYINVYIAGNMLFKSVIACGWFFNSNKNNWNPIEVLCLISTCLYLSVIWDLKGLKCWILAHFNDPNLTNYIGSWKHFSLMENIYRVQTRMSERLFWIKEMGAFSRVL